MSPRRLALPTILSLALLAPSRADAASSYTVTNLGNFFPRAINAQGIVAGQSGLEGAVFYSGYGPDAGRVSTIDSLYGAYAINASGQALVAGLPNPFAVSPDPSIKLISNAGGASAISDTGELVGGSGALGYHAFSQVGDRVTDLGTLGGPSSQANGVNAYGQVVGQADLPPSDPNRPGDRGAHAFLYSGGKMIDLGTLGGDISSASAINAAGQVVGFSSVAGGQQTLGYGKPADNPFAALTYYQAGHAFLYSGGKMTDLGTLGGGYSAATAINASGEVVGYSLVPSSSFDLRSHAFFYSDGVLHDLNALIPPGLGWTLISATGINAAGQIIGEASDSAGNEFGFLLTPSGEVAPTPPSTPEPASLALFGVLAAGLGIRLARRRRSA